MRRRMPKFTENFPKKKKLVMSLQTYDKDIKLDINKSYADGSRHSAMAISKVPRILFFF